MRRRRPPHPSIQELLYSTLLMVILLIALSQPACAISNGLPVAEDDPIRPLTVSVYSADDDCTGIKIAANLILTARHCRIDKSTRAIFHDGDAYRIVHRLLPNAKRAGRNNRYDFAILVLAANVPGPAALIADEAPRNGSVSWIAGYGGKKPTSTANRLRKIRVEMINRDYSPSAATVRTLSGGAVCDGDSGGPGYMRVLGQIMVWGIDTAPLDGRSRCSAREVYVNVTSERDWIRKMIANHAPCQTCRQRKPAAPF